MPTAIEARSAIDDAIAQAVVETNRQLPADTPLVADDDAVLVGDGGILDSLGLLGFLLAVEQHIETTHGVSLGLVGTDLAAFSGHETGSDGSVLSVGAFRGYVTKRLANERRR